MTDDQVTDDQVTDARMTETSRVTADTIPTSPAERRIVHVDLDAFYASVEIRDNPALKGLPVAVAWDGPRGVVLTASYEARAFGVKSAMPTSMARSRCRTLIFVPPRMDAYREASELIREVFHRHTDLVEPLSLDEAYLDVTVPKIGVKSGTLSARAIKQEILAATGLTASAGVASSKFLAKLASDMHKPDGLTVIRPEQAQEIVDNLAIEAFHGVGPATAKRMHDQQIYFGSDLRAQSRGDLVGWFGAHGEHFWKIARCEDDRPVIPDRARKSIGTETTYPKDLQGLTAVHAALEPLGEALAGRLDSTGAQGRTLTVKLKFADLQVISRRVSPGSVIRGAGLIVTLARGLITETLIQGEHVRLLGLSVSNLQAEDDPQKTLFSENPTAWER